MSAKWARRLSFLQLAAGVAMLVAAGWGGLILLGVISRRNLPLMVGVLALGIAASIVAILGRRALRARS